MRRSPRAEKTIQMRVIRMSFLWAEKWRVLVRKVDRRGRRSRRRAMFTEAWISGRMEAWIGDQSKSLDSRENRSENESPL